MEHIELTPEMRQRILQHIQEKMISVPSAQTIQFSSLKKYLSAAACFVLILTGVVVLPNLLNQNSPEPPLEAIQGVVEAASLQELSGLVGFEVEDIFTLPFEVTETAYVSYWNELAEVQYDGKEQSATFRMSIGTEDNSGNFVEYEDISTITVGGNSVTLKGANGAFVLAVWTDGEYSYSLQLSQAATKDDWAAICKIP